MGEREQAITLILAALVVSSGFIILAQRNRVNELETLFEAKDGLQVHSSPV